MAKTITCRNPRCPRQAGARYCSGACRVAAHRHQQRTAQPPWTEWSGYIRQFSQQPSKLANYDGTPALSRGELAERISIADARRISEICASLKSLARQDRRRERG